MTGNQAQSTPDWKSVKKRSLPAPSFLDTHAVSESETQSHRNAEYRLFPLKSLQAPMNDANISPAEPGLKPAEFEALLLRLDPNRERAGEKYEEMRCKLVRFFRWNDCFPGEELADQTFDRVAQKLNSEPIHNVPAFLWGVAKNVVREFHKRPPDLNIEQLPAALQRRFVDAESEIIERKLQERRLACLRKCLDQLIPSERALFLAYEYYAGKAQNTKHLAQRFGLSIGALQTRAHRVKYKIEKCVLKRFLSPENPFSGVAKSKDV